MPTFRQTFIGLEPEDFPSPPIARRLHPGDVVEYEADEPVQHARLALVAAPKPKKTADTPASPDKE